MEIQPPNSPTHLPFPQNSGINQSARNKETDQHTNAIHSTKPESANSQQKNPDEQRQINELKARDREVRAHELAHAAAAGGLVKSGPTFEYQRGPDGQQYAVGGEVQIDTSGVPGDPEATLQKAQQIQQAALAPAQPSAQDRSVAIAAAAMAAEARAEIASQSTTGGSDSSSNGSEEEESAQRIATKVNEAYNSTNTDTNPSKTLINLTA